jgi:hypothetical protein
MDIQKNIDGFKKERTPCGRCASFDYCFNYFRSFYENSITSELASKDNIQKSCLHLGFYLASWGMYRNSFLLRDKRVKQAL